MIRAARPTDAAAICAFWNPVIRDTAITFNPVEKTPDELCQLIAEKGESFLVWADADDQPLGFAYFGQFRGGAGYRHTVEHTIVLSPDSRGQGAGRALMQALCDVAKAQGMHSMWAGVSAANPQGVAFHRSIGFEEVATLREVGRKFDQWIDLILMQKML